MSSCDCGSSCKCGNGCNCNNMSMEFDEKITTQAIVSGVAPVKMHDEMSLETEGDGCKCGSNCACGSSCNC